MPSWHVPAGRAACCALWWCQDGICTALVAQEALLHVWGVLSPWMGFSHLQSTVPPMGDHILSPPALLGDQPVPCPVPWGWTTTLGQPQWGRFVPVLQTPRMEPYRWCTALVPRQTEMFVIDITWNTSAYFGNSTNWKDMSASSTGSLHDSPAGLWDPLHSSDFWLQSQTSFGGFLRMRWWREMTEDLFRAFPLWQSPVGFSGALPPVTGHSHLWREQGQGV